MTLISLFDADEASQPRESEPLTAASIVYTITYAGIRVRAAQAALLSFICRTFRRDCLADARNILAYGLIMAILFTQ